MSEQKRRRPKDNSSRTVVIAAVILLIVVAVAGIVLAGRRAAPAASADTTAAPTAAPSSTPQGASAPTAQVNPNEVIFAAGSDKLPAAATLSLARFAEAAKNAAGVRLSARFLTGADKARDQELARGRTAAIRKALTEQGIGAEKIQSELVEMPAGSLSAADANRVDLTLR